MAEQRAHCMQWFSVHATPPRRSCPKHALLHVPPAHRLASPAQGQRSLVQSLLPTNHTIHRGHHDLLRPVPPLRNVHFELPQLLCRAVGLRRPLRGLALLKVRLVKLLILYRTTSYRLQPCPQQIAAESPCSRTLPPTCKFTAQIQQLRQPMYAEPHREEILHALPCDA